MTKAARTAEQIDYADRAFGLGDVDLSETAVALFLPICFQSGPPCLGSIRIRLASAPLGGGLIVDFSERMERSILSSIHENDRPPF